MMPGYSDIYVLAPERTASLVWRFLEAFAPKREFSADDFTVHHANGGEQSFTSCDAAIEFCSSALDSSVSLYWRSLAPPPDHVMAFFLSDGYLLLGISTTENEAHSEFARLQHFCGSASCGYITFEEPPPDTASEFRARSNAPSAS